MTKLRTFRLIRLGQAKRLTRGDIFGPPELGVGQQPRG